MNATIPLSEQEDNLRLQRAQQHVEHCRQRENEARIALRDAEASSKRAKEKYETLFDECERRAVARRKSGQVIVNPGY